MRTDVKNLVSKSVVYGVGRIGLKVIAFFLIPLYTRYLTPADYGIIAVTSTLAAVLSIVFPLSLHGALMRFYFDTTSETERRRNSGTIWLSMVLIALSMTILLDVFGGTIFGFVLREVPFSPYIRLVIWTVFFASLSQIPLTLFQAQERPKPYVWLTIGSALLNIGLVIYLVVGHQQGVYGYLWALFLTAAIAAVPFVIVTLQQISLIWQRDIFVAALAFSLPLVPHSLASWVLELSDRVILERFVPLSELGLYSLGYQFGSIVLVGATAINFAWSPFLYKTVEREGHSADNRLSRLATYYFLLLCFVSLGVALFAKEIIQLLAAPRFFSAHEIVPWIVAAQLLSSLYYIPVSFLFVEKRTKAIPLVTVSAGGLNIGLNFWLIPRFGIFGAAWSTLLSYGVMLGLVFYVAQQVYPLTYEYKRLGQITLTSLSLYSLAMILTFNSIIAEAAFNSILVIVFPLILLRLGFFSPSEKQAVISVFRTLQTKWY